MSRTAAKDVNAERVATHGPWTHRDRQESRGRMPTSKTVWAIEIVALVAVLVIVEWLFMILTHGRNLPALLVVLALYLAARVAIALFARPS
jgi:hypothetical protein